MAYGRGDREPARETGRRRAKPSSGAARLPHVMLSGRPQQDQAAGRTSSWRGGEPAVRRSPRHKLFASVATQASRLIRRGTAVIRRRTGQFTSFATHLATGPAHARTEAERQQLADERIGLHAIAGLVAQAASSDVLFATITSEASRLVAGAPMTLSRFGSGRHLIVLGTHNGAVPIGTRIDYQTHAPPDRLRRNGIAYRVDEYVGKPGADPATEFGLSAGVSVPIMLGGRVWGMLSAAAGARPLPFGTEQRMLQLTGLISPALANNQLRGELEALTHENDALHAVAELAARGASSDRVLGAVAREASRLAGVDFSTLLRFGPDGSTEVAALDGAPPGIRVGMRAAGTGDGAVQRVWRTHKPARVDNLAAASGQWPQVAHGHGFSASVAVPVLTHGLLWGALVVVGRDRPLPLEIEARLVNFAEVAGTAIGAIQARRQLQQLADEQGGLRRVAELVARGAALTEVFDAVATEASHLLGDKPAVLVRHDDDAIVVAASNSSTPIGFELPLPSDTDGGGDQRHVTPFRADNFGGTLWADVTSELGITAGVAVPIVVEGRLWGTLGSSSSDAPLPTGTEDHLTPFAELAAAAIANAENKQKLTESRARVIATADETRRRLQRDVHDSAQQRLVHTIITLKLAKNAIATGNGAAELVDEALTNAQRANDDLREIVHGILPKALTRGGLTTGLESLVAGLSLPVRLSAAVPRLPTDIETAAYFIVAEALANVVKHAHAHEAAVQLAVDGDELDIQITDDGIGGADPRNGSGLTGLMDRVEASSGSLSLTSPAGGGTALHARLPIR